MSLGSLKLLCLLLFVQGLVVQGMANEELELDAQLKILNKPPLKTFQDKAGDIIDCVDIHKQPAFDHPLLKNHKLQLRRDSPPKSQKPVTASTSDAMYTRAVVCPEGSVPIRRTRKEDLIRAKSFLKSNPTTIHPSTGYTPGKHLAIVRSVPNPKIVYKGIQAGLAICNPVVSANQSSSSQIWIQNGARNVVNSLQAGWTVSPKLYGDSLTRSFAYWEAGPGKGCFNLLCAGFIQTDSDFILGGPINKSTYGDKPRLDINFPGPKFVVHFSIAQEMDTGNWWFEIPSHNISVGYWPKELVPLLRGGGSQVTWGGVAMGQSNGPSPQMGSGNFPARDWISDHASFFKEMFILDTTYYLVEPAGPYYQTETFVDDPKCYDLKRYGYNGETRDYSFSFGGPGGNCGV